MPDSLKIPHPEHTTFKYANGRQARLGDTVVNHTTGQRVVVTSLNPKSGFFLNQKHYLHVSDSRKKPTTR